jgi:hypothetical protein
MSKSTKIIFTISLLTVLSLSAFVGAAGAFIPGQTPTSNTQYAISEGTASTDNMVGSAATTGGANWQYSYDVNQFGCESGLYASVSVECTSLPGYSASPVCAVTYSGQCTDVTTAYALPPGDFVVFSANKSLRIAMDQYGEFISTDSATCLYTGGTTGSPCGVAGLAYGSNEAQWQATESFASTGIPPAYYVQGWTFQMNYTRIGTIGTTSNPGYAIFANAIFSNLEATEAGRSVYSWITNPALVADNTGCPSFVTTVCSSLVEGTLVPSGIQVLYDDQTLSVFRTTVTIEDNRPVTQCTTIPGSIYVNCGVPEPVAQITFTTVFNKDSKDVIVYKDLKILLSPKVLSSIAALSFSERYELDLAQNENPHNAAYIHYYQPIGGDQQTVYQHPLTGSMSYDIINAFDPLNQVNFFAAYWPNATQYSVYDPGIVPGFDTASCASSYVLCDGALGTKASTGYSPYTADIPAAYGGEPKTPWIVVQWLFTNTQYPNLLNFLTSGSPSTTTPTNQREIRFVEVFGMTDLNSGTGNTISGTLINNPFPSKDMAACLPSGGDPLYGCANGKAGGTPVNQIGVEVQYLLQQIFNPESLNTINGQSSNVGAGCSNGASSYYGIDPTEELEAYNCNHPFLWTAVGAYSAAVDSAGAAVLSPMQRDVYYDSPTSVAYPTPFALLDKNSTQQGSIPYALCEVGTISGSLSAFINGPNACAGTTGAYSTTHTDFGTNTGLDKTALYSSYLQNFYDNNVETIINVQPISGGCVSPPNEGGIEDGYLYNYSWFMPAKSPLTESWYTINYGTSTGATATPGCSTNAEYDDYTNAPVTYDAPSNYAEPTYGYLDSQTGAYTNVISNQEGIITVGGPFANSVTAYFNDWSFALDREQCPSSGSCYLATQTPYALISSGGVATNTPAPSNTGNTLDFFPISTWASSPTYSPSNNIPYSSTTTASCIGPLLISTCINPSIWYRDTNNTVGYAVISIARNTVGVRGLSVYGWNGRDTYWASAWVSQWLAEANPYYNNPFNWLPQGTVSIILAINYAQSVTGANTTWEPMSFNVVKALGTITELGFNQFLSGSSFDMTVPAWTSGLVLTPADNSVCTGSCVGTPLDPANNVNLYECSSLGLSTIHSVGFSWFSTKLPTCTSAAIQFN